MIKRKKIKLAPLQGRKKKGRKKAKKKELVIIPHLRGGGYATIPQCITLQRKESPLTNILFDNDIILMTLVLPGRLYAPFSPFIMKDIDLSSRRKKTIFFLSNREPIS